MSQEKCVIIGASHGGVQVATRLRRLGWQGSIRLIGDEPYLPYHRPPLSKDYLKGLKTKEAIVLHNEAAYEKAGALLTLGDRVVGLDRRQQQLALASGELVDYDKLVLATGSTPRALPVSGVELDGVCYLRNANDVDRIRSAAAKGGRAVIIGGGYIGLEVAASLRLLGMQVTVCEALERVLQRVTCPEVSRFFTRVHEEEGVEVRVRTEVNRIVGTDKVAGIELGSGEQLDADLVVIGIGILPNTTLADDSGLAVANGIVVNEFCQTSDPQIYAIGDCASFIHPRYQRHLRLESVQNANDQGLVAAKAICGQPEPYVAVPWFWSDQYDVKMQIAGLSFGADQVIVRGDTDTDRSMSILYLKDDKLLAVDAMNNPRDFVAGKMIIAADTSLDPGKLLDPQVPIKDAVK